MKKRVNPEMRKSESATSEVARYRPGIPRQCPAIYVTRRGGSSIVFCTKDRGHVQAGDPEHKGFRKRWVDAS